MSAAELQIGIEGMHCASCSILIDEVLEDLPGVRQSDTNLRAGVSRVRLDADVPEEALIAEITGLGYTVTYVRKETAS